MRGSPEYLVELMGHWVERQSDRIPRNAQEEAHVKRLRLMVAAAAGLALLGTGVAAAAGPYPPPSKGTGQVVPSRIKVGECAVFSGDGFAPVSEVTVRDNGVVAGTATTNTDGEFSKQLCYGSDAQRGRHDLAGSGTGSDGQPLTVYAVLIVQGVNQSAGNPNTQPGGQAASGDSTGGSDAVPVSGGTSDAAQGPGPGSPGSPATNVGVESSGTRLLLLGLTGLGFAFLASLILLLLARRRRRTEDEGPGGLDLLATA
jgi:hypothetical protein